MQQLAGSTKGERAASAPDAEEVPAVAVRGLVKAFGAMPVLDGIDLDVAARSAVALIGANGSGKSTLLKCLIRLTPCDASVLRLLGEDVPALDARSLRQLRSRVGMVFQRHNLVPRLSVLTNVVHGVQSRERGIRTWAQSLAREEVRAEALACLDLVELSHKALQRADSLSGGQSQRVAIARMLMQRPRIVLADEPDASLDPRTGDEVMSMLRRLCRERTMTLVFVSHRLEHAVRHADRIVGLAAGRMALDVASAAADPAELRAFFAEPAVEEVP